MAVYLPNIRGLVPDRVEAEIQRAIKAIYEHVNNEIVRIEKTAGKVNTTEIKRQVELFAGGLALPLTDPVGDNLATAGIETALVPADIPNLPASKITSGAFPLARIPTNVLKTDTALAEDITGAPNVNTGFTIIKDNAGNSRKVMTCA